MFNTDTMCVKLQVVEDQELYHSLYGTIFPEDGAISLTGVSTNGDFSKLSISLSENQPDVLLISTIKLDNDTVNEIMQIRDDFPDIGLLLTFLVHNSECLRRLRTLVAQSHGGIAIFSKETLVKTEDLVHVVKSVHGGQIIIDPSLTAGMFAEHNEHALLSEITSREMEILNLIAQGYTNAAIAETLFIDIRTVENHVNNLYSKLKNEPRFKNKHLRVTAAKLYLETTGELTATTA